VRRKDALAAAGFSALAVIMTWPLARILSRGVLFPGDQYHLTWILDWDWYATLHQPLRLFQANIFYPAADTLAYSEHLYGLAMLLFPLRLAGIGPLTAHNIAVIAAFAFSGFGAYLLGRLCTGSATAGVIAGIFYAYLPWRFTQLPHTHTLWAGWLPLMLAALLYCGRVSGWKSAALFGVAFLMNGLSSLHYFAFGSFAVMLSVPLAVRDRRQWLRIAAATALALAILTPFLLPYFRVGRVRGMQRTWGEVKSWSASPGDWLNPGATNRFYRRWLDPKTDPELWLFPGAAGIAMALAGTWAARNDRRTLAIALLWFAVGFFGSLGVHTFFHRFLFSHVPGFRGLRVPARWGVIAYTGMAMLIAFAAEAMRRRRRWTGALVAGLFLVELHAAPIRWYCTSPSVPPVYRWLRTQRGPIAEVPMDPDSQFRYLRYATEHHLPTVNGISSFVPPRAMAIASKWDDPAQRGALVAELRATGVKLLVVHGDQLPPAERGWMREAAQGGGIALLRRFDNGTDGDWVFTLEPAKGIASASIPPELERYLDGLPTYNESPFGTLDYPRANELLRGNALFSGWAFSPWGIREVNLLFDNGGVRLPAKLLAEPALSRAFPWYDATTRPRFVAAFPRRPANIRSDTDVQVEIVDGRGTRVLLEGRWFYWR
jgi:hypothetical protein